MSVTIDDLKPKPFTITVKGVELQCSPLRLSHALVCAKIGEVFQNATTATSEQIKQAEKDMDGVITELIPELAGVQLDINATLEVITQMMETVEPADNKYLKDKGVKFDNDLKAEKNG